MGKEKALHWVEHKLLSADGTMELENQQMM